MNLPKLMKELLDGWDDSQRLKECSYDSQGCFKFF